LEELRKSGEIGKSEEAMIILAGASEQLDEDVKHTGVDLSRLLIVSAVVDSGSFEDGVQLADESYPGLRLKAARYEAETCSRCWRRVPELVADEALPSLCERCHAVCSRLEADGVLELDKRDESR
jgi:hypothetical protein